MLLINFAANHFILIEYSPLEQFMRSSIYFKDIISTKNENIQQIQAKLLVQEGWNGKYYHPDKTEFRWCAQA